MSSAAIDAVNHYLDGSPYSLPVGDDATRQADHVIATRNDLDAEWRKAREAQRDRAESTLARLRESFDIDLVYQSNAIEGSKVTLEETAALINRVREGGLGLDGLIGSFMAEPKLEVVGHFEALELIRTLASPRTDGQWRLTVSDIRAIHQLVMVHKPRISGSFKESENQILGSDLRTASTFDVQRVMSELVDWLAQTPARPTLQATVAHAWLAHIHPFEDGNGRVARLLANLVLHRYGWPAIIVRSDSERDSYLDALKHSDEGGDILPLFELFVESLRRSVAIYSDPSLFEDALEADMKGNQRFDLWNRAGEQFISGLSRLVANYERSGLQRVGWPGPSQFVMLSKSNAGGNTTIGKVRLPDRTVQVWVGYTTDAMLDEAGVAEGPSFFFSERWDRPGFPHPWKWSEDIPGHPIQEVCIRAEDVDGRGYVRARGRTESMAVEEVANLVLGALLTWRPDAG